MRKILIGILIFLLVVMAYFAIFKGISIGKMQILSVEQIQEKNDDLTSQISQTEILMHNDYPAKTAELEKSVSSLLAAEEEYLDLADVSTESELKEASKQETYKIEYLWTRIGSHATGEGITLKLDVTAGELGEANVKNLSFSINGSYVAIINFLRAIEDDSELGFRIENFKIGPGSGTDARQATFIVRNVRIKQENTSSTVPNNIINNNNTSTQSNNNQTNTDAENKSEAQKSSQNNENQTNTVDDITGKITE